MTVKKRIELLSLLEPHEKISIPLPGKDETSRGVYEEKFKTILAAVTKKYPSRRFTSPVVFDGTSWRFIVERLH